MKFFTADDNYQLLPKKTAMLISIWGDVEPRKKINRTFLELSGNLICLNFAINWIFFKKKEAVSRFISDPQPLKVLLFDNRNNRT